MSSSGIATNLTNNNSGGSPPLSDEVLLHFDFSEHMSRTSSDENSRDFVRTRWQQLGGIERFEKQLITEKGRQFVTRVKLYIRTDGEGKKTKSKSTPKPSRENPGTPQANSTLIQRVEDESEAEVTKNIQESDEKKDENHETLNEEPEESEFLSETDRLFEEMKANVNQWNCEDFGAERIPDHVRLIMKTVPILMALVDDLKSNNSQKCCNDLVSLREEVDELRTKVTERDEVIETMKKEKDLYTTKVKSFKQIEADQGRYKNRMDLREARWKKDDRNLATEVVIVGAEEDMIELADKSNKDAYMKHEHEKMFKIIDSRILDAQKVYAARVEEDESAWWELSEAPGVFTRETIVSTYRHRPHNKKRCGYTREEPTFKRWCNVKNKFVDFEDKHWCRNRTNLINEAWKYYVEECQDYLVRIGNLEYNKTFDKSKLVKRMIHKAISGRAKEAARQMHKEARLDEIRRWKLNSMKKRDLAEKKITDEEYENWLNTNDKESPNWIKLVMYTSDRWPELVPKKFIEGKSRRYVNPKDYDESI